MLYGLVVLILVLVMIQLILTSGAKFLAKHAQESRERAARARGESVLPEIHFAGSQHVDCHNTKLPCIDNADCQRNCALTRDGGVSSCIGGFCSTDHKSIPEKRNCVEEHGILRVFTADEFVINQSCLSTYRDIFTDDNKLQPYVCTGGQLEINLLEQAFTPDACVCGTGTTKYIYRPGPYNRPIPVCLTKQQAALLGRVYERA
ncbi:CUN046 similar to AcMNPV ORF115 [Culex nigripalpus nucleopolyhedrovirus]|uniref:Pif-3 n=2 Tax=Deltabaculovirus TaxID=558019 RepID=Q99GR4_NPVCN|nr:CUN046 similar to AcMNPV ORF115 [Culex nigripalpus nucleopolyhedrovirus]AAK13261.1 unknown [Culex nigripalpus nucleopolyhedrovirus]AAK94124.1 CUN046 similar to AcMNPV ORF115 [Culex nigripalpus nucleopolyhedrovirus]